MGIGLAPGGKEEMAHFYYGHQSAITNLSPEVKTVLEGCVIRDKVLWHLWRDGIDALAENNQEKWEAYKNAADKIGQYAIAPCLTAGNTELVQSIALTTQWVTQAVSDDDFIRKMFERIEANIVDIGNHVACMKTSWDDSEFEQAGYCYGQLNLIVFGSV